MPQTKFKYQKFVSIESDGTVNTITRPYIPVRFKYANNFEKMPFLCLVDSGADRNLFPADIGEIPGVNIKKDRVKNHVGIGGIVVKSYIHEIKMFVGGNDFATEIDFSYEQKIPLLCRHKFFKYFENVAFHEKEKFIILEY